MDSLSAQAQAQVQANLNALGTSAKAQIQATTGVDLNNQRVQQGATSALSLLQNGYNPASDADSAQLIHAIAGGCALIPGGAVFGAYIELLWQAGQAVACPLENAFAAIGLGQPSPTCGGAPCTHTGPPSTPASIIAESELPQNWNQVGSFSSLAVGALATYAAQNLNCKGGVPPGMVIDAVIAVWNQTHSNSDYVSILIPPLEMFGTGSSGVLIPYWQSISSNSPSGSIDPYVFYAFQSVTSIMQQDQAALSTPVQANGSWAPWSVMTGLPSTNPRVVSINNGPLIVPAGASAPKAPTTVAGHVAALGVGGVVGGMALAWATGQSGNAVFSAAWRMVQGWVKGGLEGVERHTGPLSLGGGASERPRRRRRRATSRR